MRREFKPKASIAFAILFLLTGAGTTALGYCIGGKVESIRYDKFGRAYVTVVLPVKEAKEVREGDGLTLVKEKWC